jgi:hypothetical protein
VDFRAVVSGNVGPAEVVWDFGDDSTSEHRITSHVYVLDCSAGPVKSIWIPPQPQECTREYHAVATVSDGLDRSASCSKKIKVRSQSQKIVVTMK